MLALSSFTLRWSYYLNKIFFSHLKVNLLKNKIENKNNVTNFLNLSFIVRDAKFIVGDAKNCHRNHSKKI